MQYCSIDKVPHLVYINDLYNALEHSETNLFADDTNLLTCTVKMTSEAQRKINDDLSVFFRDIMTVSK